MEGSIVITTFQKLQLIVAKLTNELLESQTLVSEYYASNQVKPILKIFAKEKEEPIELSYQHFWFEGVRSSPTFIEQLTLFSHLATPRYLSTAITLLINWLSERPGDVPIKYIDGSINYQEYYSLIKDNSRIFSKFIASVVDIVVADAIAHLMRYFDGENIDPELLHVYLPALCEYFHGPHKESRYMKGVLTEEIWDKLYESIREQWRCIYGIISYKWSGFKIEDVIRRSIIEKDLRFRRLPMLKYLKTFEFATNYEIISCWRCISSCISETKNQQAREMLIDIFASVISTSDNSQREDQYQLIYHDSIKWAKNAPTQLAAINLQCSIIAFGALAFYDANIDKTIEKILKIKPGPPSQTIRLLNSLLVLLRGKYFEFPFHWKVPDRIFFTPRSNFTRRNIQIPLKFECPYAIQSLSLFPPKLKARITAIFALYGSKSRLLKDIDICDELLALSNQILLQICSQSAFYFTSHIDDVIFNPRGDVKAKFAAISACQLFLANDTPLDFINSAFSLWNKPFNSELSGEFFVIKIRDSCFREINTHLTYPPEIISQNQSDLFIPPKLLIHPFSLICYDVTLDDKQIPTAEKVFELESAKRWRLHFNSMLLKDLNEETATASNRVNGALSNWCISIGNSLNPTITSVALIPQKTICPWAPISKGRKTYTLYMKSVETVYAVIDSAAQPEKTINFLDCLYHQDISLVDACSKTLQELFLRYPDLRLSILRAFIANAKLQNNSNNRARLMSQLLFILDLLSSLQRMEGILISEFDGTKIRSEIDLIVLLYLSDFSPLVRQLALNVSKTAYSIWQYQPQLSIAYMILMNSEYILEVSRYRYLYSLENRRRNILSKEKNFHIFPTIEEVAVSKHTAYWLFIMTTIANELYLQKFPLLYEASEILLKYLEPINEEKLSTEKDMVIIAQRLLILSLRNSISLVTDSTVHRVFLNNSDDWKIEHFFIYISHANSQAMDDLINIFYNWYTSMKKKELFKTFPKIIRFLRTISSETNFQRLVAERKRDVIPKLTELIIDITTEYIIPELNQNKFGNEEIFIDYALFIYDLSSCLIIPSPYAPNGPLRQSLIMMGIEELWDLKDREMIFESILDWAFYDYTVETNKILAGIKDLPKKEQKKLYFQNTKQSIHRSSHISIEALTKLNCFTDTPTAETLHQLYLIETVDENRKILHWVLAYHFDQLIQLYLDKSYYYRDQYLEGKHFASSIFNMYAPIPLRYILPTPASYIQREILMYSRIEEELFHQQKTFSSSPLTTQDLGIGVSTQHKSALLFLVASYHTINEDSVIREKAFDTLHRLIESNFGSINISNIKNNHNSSHIFISDQQSIDPFHKSVIQFRNSPSIKECKFNAIQLSSIAAINSPELTSAVFIEAFKRVPIIGSDDFKFWILRILIPWCNNINLVTFHDYVTEEISNAQDFLKNLFQSISIAINSAHRNVPTPVLRVWQSLACSPLGENKNVEIMTDFLINRSFELQAEDDPDVIYNLCKSILIAIYITPQFCKATQLINIISFSEIYSTIVKHDNFKKIVHINDDNLNLSPIDVHARSLTLDILCSLCESNSFFLNLLSQIHFIFIWCIIRMNSSSSKDVTTSINLAKNILFKFQQLFSSNESILVPDQLRRDLDRWILLLSCKTSFMIRKLLFPIDDLSSNNNNTTSNNNNNNISSSHISLSQSSNINNQYKLGSSAYLKQSEQFNIKLDSIDHENITLMGDSLISTFVHSCGLLSSNLTYLSACESLYWASYSSGIITTISYRIFKFSVEQIDADDAFDTSIIHSLISNLLTSFSAMESSISSHHSKPSISQYSPLKTIPENQSICLEILNIFISISQKFIHRNEVLFRFELHILFAVLYIVNSPLVFHFDCFIPIIAKCFELLLHMVVNGLFDRIHDDHHFRALFKKMFKKIRSDQFHGLLPSLIKGVYITKLELSAVQLMRALIEVPSQIQPLIYPSDHACMFLGLAPWIISQLMLFGTNPTVLAYVLCKELSLKSNFEQIRSLSHLAITVNTNQFITSTCSAINPQSKLDLQSLSDIFKTILMSNRGPTFSSATVVVTSLLYSNNQTDEFINQFDFLFTQWSSGAQDQEFTVVVPLLEILRSDVNHSLHSPKKYFTLSTSIKVENLGDFQSSLSVIRSFLDDEFLTKFNEPKSSALQYATILIEQPIQKEKSPQIRSIPRDSSFENEITNGHSQNDTQSNGWQETIKSLPNIIVNVNEHEN